MADKNFKGGPGGRLKAAEAKNTLYVNNPNDPRLRMYEDSLTANDFIKNLNKGVDFLKSQPMDRRREYYKNFTSLVDELPNQKETMKAVSRLEKANKKQYGTEEDKKRKPVIISAPKNYRYEISPEESVNEIGLNYMKEQLPKRKVVFKREEIEPISPRQSPAPTFTPEEIVAPVMRPFPMENPVVTEEVAIQKPIARKLPRAVMPTRQGGWGNQPLLMQLFPKLYEK